MKKEVCKRDHLLATIAVSMALLLGTSSTVFADDAVKLKVLVIAHDTQELDSGLAYIKPVLDEMGVPYDVLNADKEELTAAHLAAINNNPCTASQAGCIGNYNGIILTEASLGQKFTPAEWITLHNYEKDFKVREAVLSGWPGPGWDPEFGIYLHYGVTVASAGIYNGKWSIPVNLEKQVFEYVNKTNNLAITEWGIATVPFTPTQWDQGPADGTKPVMTPLLQADNGDGSLISIIQYKLDGQTAPIREVLLSTINNAWFAIHSNVLAYEFINWATQGVFVGARGVYMAAHLDDLFVSDSVWDPALKHDSPTRTYRLNGNDIYNAIYQQDEFRRNFSTIRSFKLDFPFNGSGAVTNPNTWYSFLLTPNWMDSLVTSISWYGGNFRYINHTFTHADMDAAPQTPAASCDYNIFTRTAQIEREISWNRAVWDILWLPERSQNNRVLVTGNHSGLKNRNCTDYPELHPEMFNVQDDDIPFPVGANPLLFNAAINTGVRYIASDASQVNQNIEQYHSNVLMLPRWPTNVFYNVITPSLLVDEYNHIFYDRFINAGQNPCEIPGAICNPRNYSEILQAEAETALRHMLTFKKWPHFFHQSNLARYDRAGNTLQFDWLRAVFTEYEKVFTLPVKNYPYYQLGDLTKDGLTAKNANINAVWNRSTNRVTLSADKRVPNLEVTGLSGGKAYGGQLIGKVTIGTTPVSLTVDRLLNY